MKVLINDTDYNIVVNLYSNVSITGSYIDANKATVDKLENMLSKQLSNSIGSTSVNLLSTFNKTAIQTLAPTIQSAPVEIPYSKPAPVILKKININPVKNVFQNQISVSGLKLIQNLVIPPAKDTYTHINNYFNSSGFYYVTGYTNSRYQTLLASFVDVGNQVNVIKSKVGLGEAHVANLNVNSIISAAQAPENTKLVPNIVQKNPKNLGVVPVGTNQTQLNKAFNMAQPLKAANNVNFEVLVKPNTDDSYKTNKKILIHGTDIYGMILNMGTYKEHVLYVGSDYPIKYIDFPDGRTKFVYRRSPDVINNDANIILYPGLIEEPKILNEVFIDRGVNNAFEPVKRLKNVKTLDELVKIGLGFYKMNTKGFNFKNTQ